MKLLLVLLLVLSTQSAEIVSSNMIANVFQTLYNYKVSSAESGTSILGYETELGWLWQNTVSCTACTLTSNAGSIVLGSNLVKYATEKVIVYFCSKVMNHEVCDGTVKEMSTSVWDQVFKHLTKGDYLCSRVFGFCSHPHYNLDSTSDYVKRVLKDKPDFLKDNDYINKQYENMSKDSSDQVRKTLKIMHVTDIHVDLEYLEGTNTDCGEPICCRKENGVPSDPTKAAGKYGSYNCDLPPITMNSFFEFAKEMQDDIDLIIWTGDNIAHDVWEQSVDKNANYTEYVTNIFKETFPGMPVFPALGNHEFFPVNVQRFDGVHPVIDKISSYWSDWIGQQGIDDFKNFGFYNIPLKGIREDWEGYRVITLNTETCNSQNWYLLSELNDPSHHLQWLEDQFIEMEKTDEKAFIIGHVMPTVGGCTKDWAIRYQALIERYQHLVLAHLFGHEHVENFYVFKDSTNTSAIGNIQMPGGVNTNGDKNPVFRIYELDYETRYPVKAHKYYFNITAANEGNPEWKYMYETTAEYNMKDFSPSSFMKVSEDIRDDSDVASRFVRNSYSMATTKMNAVCTGHCQHSYYCETANSLGIDIDACKGKAEVDFQNDFEGSFNHMMFDIWFEKS